MIIRPGTEVTVHSRINGCSRILHLSTTALTVFKISSLSEMVRGDGLYQKLEYVGVVFLC
jgi:hypothetical protein